jgi:hypothetical protein
MGIGTSLTLIAIGAILRYAVTIPVKGVVLPTVGLILMIVGIVGLVISLAYMFGVARPRDRAAANGRIDERPHAG